jgi:hypothetical protein
MLMSPSRSHVNTQACTENIEKESGWLELGPGNRACLLDHLLGLDQREKNRRFLCGTSNSFITRYYLGINWERHVAIAWRQSGLVTGIAELARVTDSWEKTELAISMARSIATCADADFVRYNVMQAACIAARRRGAAEIIIWFGSEEHCVFRLAYEYGGAIDWVRQCATIPLLGIENIPSNKDPL